MEGLFLEFAKNTIHTHIFINNRCKFCHLDIKLCDHNSINLTTTYNRGNKTEKCSCGYTTTRECLHSHFSSGRVDEIGEYYDYCEECGKEMI
jgi:hypothetical protein